MQTLIMLCLKDKDSIWEVGVTEQKPKSKTAGTCPFSFKNIYTRGNLPRTNRKNIHYGK